MYHALIIDDELAGRQCIRKLVETHFPRQLSRISEADDLQSGIKAIEELKPDLIFLDIYLNGENAFDLLDEIQDVQAEIIFVTAFDEFAVKAFRYAAVDYLQKPIEADEFHFAVQKAINRLYAGESLKQLNQIVRLLKAPEKRRIAVPSGNAIYFIDLNEIVYCEAANCYTYIHTQNGERHCISRTLKNIQESIDLDFFVRVHQSYLVNLDQVDRYQRGEGGTLHLKNGKEIPVSRANRENLLDVLLNRMN